MRCGGKIKMCASFNHDFAKLFPQDTPPARFQMNITAVPISLLLNVHQCQAKTFLHLKVFLGQKIQSTKVHQLNTQSPTPVIRLIDRMMELKFAIFTNRI